MTLKELNRIFKGKDDLIHSNLNKQKFRDKVTKTSQNMGDERWCSRKTSCHYFTLSIRLFTLRIKEFKYSCYLQCVMNYNSLTISNDAF